MSLFHKLDPIFAQQAGGRDEVQEKWIIFYARGLHHMWEKYPDLLTTDQAAELLQVHPNTIRNMIKDGRLKAKDLGHATGYRIRKRDLAIYAGAAADPCEEYRVALQCLLDAIEDFAGERGQQWTQEAHDAVENARRLLEN